MVRPRVRRTRGTARWIAAIGGALIAGLIASAGSRVSISEGERELPGTRRTPAVGGGSRASISECEREVRRGQLERGAEICLADHARTGDQESLSWAAQAYMYMGEIDQTEELARRLLWGSLHAEGHRLLAYVMLRRGDKQLALEHATAAFVARSLVGDDLGLTSAAILLSQAAWKVGDFPLALAAADDALSRARYYGDPRSEVAALLAHADALRRLGEFQGAEDALASAVARASHPCDAAWANLKMAMYHMEFGQKAMHHMVAGHDDDAMSTLSQAERANRSCKDPYVSTSIAINQAWLLRRRDPRAALARLDAVEKEKGEQVETLLLRGYIAADQGAFAAAEHYFVRAERLEAPDADWPWEIARARAELAELFSAVVAERHYRRAIDLIASLRSTAQASSAYLVSSHRYPYDGLIALLASAGKWRDALAVILELDASDMLRATAAEAVARDRAPLAVAPPGSNPGATPAVTVDEVLAAWRSRDLVIVIAPARREIGGGNERAYRLRIANGRITGEDVGDARGARAWADALLANHEHREAARALGRMIVPPDPTGETLDVLAIGPLGSVPLAALRDDDGSLIIRRRPLARVLALRPGRVTPAGAGPPVVIANPRGDLPRSTDEGREVVEALGAGARLSGFGTGSPATRERLLEARDAGVLHIAAHVGRRGRQRVLELADGYMAPAEVVQKGLAPRIAVLASCGSAAAQDEEGWGSMAAALLEAGTTAVIATDRSIDDGASRMLMRDFYAQPDWRDDPARALARAQQRMDEDSWSISGERETSARVWPAFVVLRRPPPATAPPAQ